MNVGTVDQRKGNKVRRGNFKKKGGDLETQNAKGRVSRASTKTKEGLSNHNNLGNTNGTSSLNSKDTVENVEHGGTNVKTATLAKKAALQQSLTLRRVVTPKGNPVTSGTVGGGSRSKLGYDCFP